MIIMITAAVMVAATMMQHLGLTEAIAKVALKIGRCNMCCTFWSTLMVMVLMEDVPLHIGAVMAITAAYVSNWFVMLLAAVEKYYHKLWQRLLKQ